MMTRKIAAIVGTTLVALGITAASAGASPGDDRGAFNRILKQQYDAWYEEDGAKFAATFTKDADLVTFNGDHLVTRDGIARGMQYYFDNFIDHTKLKVLDEHVRFAGPNSAFIVRTTCITVPPSEDCRDGSVSRNTNVMSKRDGRWLQESFQNTRVVALPAQSATSGSHEVAGS